MMMFLAAVPVIEVIESGENNNKLSCTTTIEKLKPT